MHEVKLVAIHSNFLFLGSGSWDCGDFKGDPLMECEGELCNTLLIHGPTGAGKSAAVFACAEQLGFKVRAHTHTHAHIKLTVYSF